MSKTADQQLAEIRAERLRLESDAKALRRVEEALKKRHRPRPARKKR